MNLFIKPKIILILLVYFMLFFLFITPVHSTEITLNKIKIEGRSIIVDFSVFKDDTLKYLVKVGLNCNNSENSEQVQKFYARKKTILYNFTSKFNMSKNNCLLSITGLGKNLKYNITTNDNGKIKNFNVILDYNMTLLFVEVYGNTNRFELVSDIYKDNRLFKSYRKEYPLKNRKLIEQDLNLNPGYYTIYEKLIINGQVFDEKRKEINITETSVRRAQKGVQGKVEEVDRNNNEAEQTNKSKELRDNNSKDSGLNSKSMNSSNLTTLNLSSGQQSKKRSNSNSNKIELLLNHNILIGIYVFLFLSVMLNIILIIRR